MIDLSKITIHEQGQSGTCGPAALRNLLSYFGIHKTEAELENLCETDKHGTRPRKLEEALKSLGFKTQSGHNENAEKSWEHLNYWVNVKKLPVIVDFLSTVGDGWDGHYVVVLDITQEYITLGDSQFEEPERRVYKLSRSNFLRVWLDWESDYLEKPEDINIRWWLVAYRD